MYEDVFEWILDAFDDLNNMEDLADDLETIKIQVTFNSWSLTQHDPKYGNICKSAFAGIWTVGSTIPNVCIDRVPYFH